MDHARAPVQASRAAPVVSEVKSECVHGSFGSFATELASGKSGHDAAARNLLELANAFEPVQDGRIYIEKINGPFLCRFKGTPAEYKAGLDLCISKGWLWLHESGTYVKLTEAGAAMFA